MWFILLVLSRFVRSWVCLTVCTFSPVAGWHWIAVVAQKKIACFLSDPKFFRFFFSCPLPNLTPADGNLNIEEPLTIFAPLVDPGSGYKVINPYNPLVYLGK